LRKRIDDQIARGASDREIIDFMVSRYGDFVLYRPPFKAKTWLLWFGPPMVLILSFAGLFRYLRVRRSRLEQAELPEEDRARASHLLSGNADDRP
jgi:cytochrome c-type biogenesis protein CcmH